MIHMVTTILVQLLKEDLLFMQRELEIKVSMKFKLISKMLTLTQNKEQYLREETFKKLRNQLNHIKVEALLLCI